jgi:hypothetical protein
MACIFFLISKHSAITCMLQFGAYKEDATIGVRSAWLWSWVHNLTSNPSLFLIPRILFWIKKKFHSVRKIYYWSMTNFLPNLRNASIKTLFKLEQNFKFEQFWNLNIFQIQTMMKSKLFKFENLSKSKIWPKFKIWPNSKSVQIKKLVQFKIYSNSKICANSKLFKFELCKTWDF